MVEHDYAINPPTLSLHDVMLQHQFINDINNFLRILDKLPDCIDMNRLFFGIFVKHIKLVGDAVSSFAEAVHPFFQLDYSFLSLDFLAVDFVRNLVHMQPDHVHRLFNRVVRNQRNLAVFVVDKLDKPGVVLLSF